MGVHSTEKIRQRVVVAKTVMTPSTIASPASTLDHYTKMIPVGMQMHINLPNPLLWQTTCSTTHSVASEPSKRRKSRSTTPRLTRSSPESAVTSSKVPASRSQLSAGLRPMPATQTTLTIARIKCRGATINLAVISWSSIRFQLLNRMWSPNCLTTRRTDSRPWASRNSQARRRISRWWTDRPPLSFTSIRRRMQMLLSRIRRVHRQSSFNLYIRSFLRTGKAWSKSNRSPIWVTKSIWDKALSSSPFSRRELPRPVKDSPWDTRPHSSAECWSKTRYTIKLTKRSSNFHLSIQRYKPSPPRLLALSRIGRTWTNRIRFQRCIPGHLGVERARQSFSRAMLPRAWLISKRQKRDSGVLRAPTNHFKAYNRSPPPLKNYNR